MTTLEQLFVSSDSEEAKFLRKLFKPMVSVEGNIRFKVDSFHRLWHPFGALMEAKIPLRIISGSHDWVLLEIVEPTQEVEVLWSYGFLDPEGYAHYLPWRTEFYPQDPDFIGSFKFRVIR